MSDPVEEALRAIEARYYPDVIEGKALMPFYPRADVAIMVEAAVKAEREACAKIVHDLWDDPEGAYTADYVEAAIRNRT